MWRRGGPGDVFWGVIAGSAAGIMAGAILGSVFLVLEIVPHTVVGALLNFITWGLAWAAARRAEPPQRRRPAERAESSRAEVERDFWLTMVKYSPVGGAVFGVLLYAASLWLFTSDAEREVYSGYKLLAAPPALALAILLAGVLHIGLAGKSA